MAKQQVNSPNLSKFFRLSLINFEYIPKAPVSRTIAVIFAFIRWLTWPALIAGVLRNIIFLLWNRDYLVALYFGNFGYFLGPAGFWLIMILTVWLLDTLVCYFYISYSNYTVQLQHWIGPLASVLDEPRKTRDPMLRLLGVSLYFMMKWNLMSGGFTGWAFYLPLFARFPIKFIGLTFVEAIVSGFQGYLIASYAVNFGFLVSFYLLYCGQRLAQLEKDFDAMSTRVSRNLGYHGSIKVYQRRLMSLAKEMYRCNQFWSRINQGVFIGSFLAQIPILYLIFFVEMEGIVKYIVIFLGILNFVCGQTINFATAIFTQNKFDECVDRQRRYLYQRRPLPIQARLEALTMLQCLTGREIFTVVGSLGPSSSNYLVVQLEMVGLLLLLLSNANRSGN